jgi:hypothetical protein
MSRDLKWCTPDDDDFKLISEAYVDCKTNGDKAALEHRPEKLAHDAEHVWGDMGTAVKWMIIAAFLGWKELFELLKEVCPNVGWATGEISQTMQELKKQSSALLTTLYNKYCGPALVAVANGSSASAAQPATTGGLPKNLKVFAQPNAKFCRLVVYDPRYNPPARRHLYLTKKQNGTYRVSLGGATVTSWYNEPFFESVQQAKDFLSKISGVNTSNNMVDYHFCITDKPVASGTTLIVNDLSNCVLVDSACGPAYIHKKNSYCVESLREEVVEEDIEKHDELNPALFDEEAKLRPEVKEKINEIVDEFLKEFAEVEVILEVQDIILTGSNASYNYTKNSDLDIHIVADTSKIEDTLKLHKVIYDAYKSSFNKKFEIELNSVPVELYVEIQDTPLVSNGIYSVLNDEWVKEPTKEDIPEVDQEAIDTAFKPWEKRYKALVAATTEEVEDESEIDKFIDALYELRGKGLSTDGEYSIENLVFKEMRNKGYLDNLKELRHQVIARRLSLFENLDKVSDYFELLNKLF